MDLKQVAKLQIKVAKIRWLFFCKGREEEEE